MDANGQRFWTLAEGSHWLAHEHTAWDPECRVLGLASERSLPEPADRAAALSAAMSALERIPRAVDTHGAVAYWDSAANAIVARSHLPGEAVALPLDTTPSDLCVAHDGILYALLPDTVHMHDLRGRWPDQTVPTPGFAPWRSAVDPAGGLWLLERTSGRLARLTGFPMSVGPLVEFSPEVFRPDPENCHPPALRLLDALAWETGERPLALACHPQAGLALLSWVGDGGAGVRRLDGKSGRLGPRVELLGARYAYALAWLDGERLAVRMPGRRDAPAFALSAADETGLPPSGDLYPLAAEALEAPFAHRLESPPHYPLELAEGVRGTEPLHRLSLSNLAQRGEARHFEGERAYLLDSGRQDTVWHRLYAEATIPPRAGFTVWLATTAEARAPAPEAFASWLPHHFGEVPAGFRIEPFAARAAWERAPSELPHHPGLAPWARERDRAGLFSALIQDPWRQVRTLTGRYLWMRVALYGDGRIGPRIAALRAWGSRFSYRDQYLPRLYRESLFGAAAAAPGERLDDLEIAHLDALDGGGAPAGALLSRLEQAGLRLGSAPEVVVERAGQDWRLHDAGGRRAWRLRREGEAIGLYRPRATPADFLDRMLASFEGVLTPLEDRIAAAHLLTDPACAPQERLDWLAAWLGIAFDPALPEARRRAWLDAAPQLARWHGTRRGLALALDLASDGGVRGGEIAVLEDFRLRRLLATLLGVDLAVERDPLLPGLIESGNSVVGDTLVLGDAERAELLALFREEVATEAENVAVLEFLDRLAHRATVLVHQEVSPQDLGLLRRVVELEAPAHVEVRVLTATWPLLVGVASLVGVDTYLGPPRLPRPARLDASGLGQGDYLLGPVSVDPRLSGAAVPAPAPARPTADAGPDREVVFGESFTLDGGASEAPPGRRIARFIWRQLD